MMCAAEKRFVEAFEMLRADGRLTVTGFSEEAGISQGTFGSWKSGKTTRHARIEWFTALCRHGVSGQWLLTGEGPMFKK